MVRILFILLICLAAPHSARAGAWLREAGAGFLSVSGTGYHADPVWEYRSSLFAEWGLHRNMTLGLDADEYQLTSGHALLFARFPLYRGDGGGRAALEFGVGTHHWWDQWSPMYRGSVSYGKGFGGWLGAGWFAADLSLERRDGTDADLVKLDLTAGMSEGRRLNPMLQVETARPSGKEILWSVTPSVIVTLRDDLRLVLGAERRSAFPDSYGIKLSLWREF
ncbi:hypothetical protein SAMN05444007_108205 [Cribrihabitans marinus]|uniref:MetA-pathway of phenol degradation n=1 Tax=Cribrihabitans marinus TaxID=1227549 RepID=A0A1H7CMT1_9RHOB|nr:hypothetical protein [Cribrihabitans marinus]GGH36034.1 hypothetical protein GCM10010973_29740 [Cribrihabitans marinus]SEJ90766.1 hypothetical protein SAMN05444007_108205 [Cribrihabitans marinus]